MNCMYPMPVSMLENLVSIKDLWRKTVECTSNLHKGIKLSWHVQTKLKETSDW